MLPKYYHSASNFNDYYHPGFLQCKIKAQQQTKWFEDPNNILNPAMVHSQDSNINIMNRNKEFVRNLKEGGFIPCGDSGGCLNRTYKSGCPFLLCLGGTFTCSFVFGMPCTLDPETERRWSCCGQTLKGDLKDMDSIKGCLKK